MYRLSPLRSHRSKGFKVKHILQICLLLVVCFWLTYQVKRSHDKRKEFDTKDKLVGKVQTDGEIQRFGRKDLPGITEIATNDEKHSEDEEEKEAEEEGNKQEEDEPEREDDRIKVREEEDMSRGDGVDEIDENEPEKIDHEDELEKSEAEAEAKHEKERVDEDTGREKNKTATQENHIEDDDVEEEENSESEENKDTVNDNHTELEENEDGMKEDHNDYDHGGSSRNTHEAREEQYKADDASSEVAQNIETTIPQTENAATGHANEILGKVNFRLENETKTTDQDDAGVHPQEDKATNNGALSNITADINSTKSVDSSLQNSTLPAPPNDQQENSGNSSAVGAEHSALLSTDGTETSDAKTNSLSNVPEHVNKSKQAANEVKQRGDAAGSNKTEIVNNGGGESKISSNKTSVSSHKTSDSDTMSAEDEKLENGSEESGNTIQHDPIDASDATITQEEKEFSTIMDTLPLPEIRNEVQNSVNTTAE